MKNKQQSLEGQWSKLLQAGTYGENSYSPDDLDEIVRNFDPKSTKQIPIVFGRAGGAGPVVANVVALKRDGVVLNGKLTNVDPRFDQVTQAEKIGNGRSFVLSRSSKGLSLDKVGFHPQRVYRSGVLQDAPAADADLTNLANGQCEGGELEFACGGSSFRSGTSSLKRLSYDTNSSRLCDLAKERQQEKVISFGEALGQVAAEHPELTLPGDVVIREEHVPQRRPRTYEDSVQLSSLAKVRQRERSVSFGEALSQVAIEHPELT